MPPKPRPRPRPTPRQASGSGNASSSNLSASNVQKSKSAREQELDKDDVFFLRNRNRTAKDWKKLDEMEKERESSAPAAESDAEDDVEASPRKRQRIHRNTRDGNGLPAWTKQDIINILSSDDDDLDLFEDDYGTRSSSHGGARLTKKRPRSRSRSLTPPPELSMQQIQHTRNAVRQALETAPRPASPTNYQADESTDTIILDPELASIQRAIMLEASRTGGLSRSLTPDRGGGPENVVIKVNWRPHPLNTAAKPRIMGFKLKRHDRFSALFDEVADDAGVLVDNIVVTYDGSRVFASATPHSLKIWAEAEMDASDKPTYDYLRQHRHQRPPPSSSHPRERSPSLAAEGGNDSDTDVQSTQEVDDDDDTFKLVVRSSSTKDVTLTVRPSTTCGAIVKAFLKRAGLADKYPEGKSRRKSVGGGPRLIIDGDHMAPETPISEADLEDGDQVEIAGL
ncbi:hypothetical protein OF83DRAFT_1096336 [Amylostereum chailletii]|nr:hypothetical protein OF83DRAFT_1096336 [Amylostereum chailletii]